MRSAPRSIKCLGFDGTLPGRCVLRVRERKSRRLSESLPAFSSTKPASPA